MTAAIVLRVSSGCVNGVPRDWTRLTLYTSGHTTRYACMVELRISNGLYEWTRSRCFEKAVKSSARGTGKRVD